MSEIKLKPCPFCGGEAKFEVENHFSSHHNVGFEFRIGCEECGMKLQDMYKLSVVLEENGEIQTLTDERKKAADLWNRRATE